MAGTDMSPIRLEYIWLMITKRKSHLIAAKYPLLIACQRALPFAVSQDQALAKFMRPYTQKEEEVIKERERETAQTERTFPRQRQW